MTILSSNNSPLFLPKDIIFDMLCCLPVKSVLRFKCVCEHWNDITQDFQFICLHYKHSPLIIEEKPSNGTAGCKDEFEPLPASPTRGLVLEYATRPSHFPFSPNLRFRIRNPEMQNQIFEIPDSKSSIWNMCIMFDPDCQVLKLLSLVYDRKSIGYEVLDLQNEESSYCWRPLVLNLPEQSQGETRICNKQNKSIGVVFGMGIGYIFWDIDNGSVPNPSIGIDVLDMVNDRYIGHTTYPMNYYTKDECILWNGKLSFAKIVKDELHILVLEFDYKKQMKLIDRKLVVKLPFMRELSALISDQSELWFWWNDKNKKSLNSFYDTTAKKVKYSHFNTGHNYSYAERSNYVLRRSCLVAFKGMNKTT